MIELAHEQNTYRCIWLYRTESECRALREKGLNHYPLKSIRGYWYSLRADLAFIAYGFNDLNGTAIYGAKIVNVWHGTPLKKIYFDSPQLQAITWSRKIKRFIQMQFTRRISLFPVSSELSKTRVESAFRLGESVAKVIGEPRTDKIFNRDRPHVSHAGLIGNLARLGADSLLLYAPTWREYSEKFDMDDFEALVKAVESMGKYLVFRAHPLDQENPILNIKHERLIYLPCNKYQDINEYLYLFGALITDYSSIAIDFSLLKRPIYFFAHDLDTYDRQQGFYETYESFTSSIWHNNWRSLASTLTADWKGGVQENCCAKSIRERYHFYSDGRSATRTYELCRLLSSQ